MEYSTTHIALRILLFLSMTVVLSCKDTPKNPKQKALQETVNANLGKELLLPDDLSLYTPFSNYVLDSAQIANSNLKIFTHINTSCSTCVENIASWNKVALNFRQLEVPVILVCTSKDNFELFKYLCENNEVKTFSYPFFQDPNKEYVSANRFMQQDAHLETVLTDRDHKIVLMGNPTYDENIYNLYKSEIQKRASQQVVTGQPVVGGASKKTP